LAGGKRFQQHQSTVTSNPPFGQRACEVLEEATTDTNETLEHESPTLGKV
jgi:predicted RNA methylase